MLDPVPEEGEEDEHGILAAIRESVADRVAVRNALDESLALHLSKPPGQDPRHLKFVGPFESFDRPEPYLASLARRHHIIARLEPKKMFVDSPDVCLLYDLRT